jgi:hypothetical protein
VIVQAVQSLYAIFFRSEWNESTTMDFQEMSVIEEQSTTVSWWWQHSKRPQSRNFCWRTWAMLGNLHFVAALTVSCIFRTFEWTKNDMINEDGWLAVIFWKKIVFM